MDLPLRPLRRAFGRTGTVPWYEYINAGLRRGVPEEVMSDKLYRIKPLVWTESGTTRDAWRTKDPTDGGAFSVWPNYGAPGYHCSLKGFPNFATAQQAMEAIQCDYEQRLISAGVVEEVERAGTN